jgi:uncharacterized membrane protein
MTHQQAVSVVAVPLDAVERRLRDVGEWPEFLLGLERVGEISFGRYTFTVKDGPRTRELDVAVVAHPREHRIVWHALHAPRFDGEIRLTAVDDRHTKVSLSLTAEPAGFLAGLSEMLSHSDSTATLDLQRLEQMLSAPTG